jgi:transcriptional regulator with XRE-family HTH domain
VKSIKEIRKAKGLTLETLSKACGVSAKTILQYEHEPPKRPSRKVVDKLSHGLGISAEEMLQIIQAPGHGMSQDGAQDTIELSDAHMAKVVSLVEKEIRELQLLLLEYADIQSQHPALAKAMDYISDDINLLTEIQGFFS